MTILVDVVEHSTHLQLLQQEKSKILTVAPKSNGVGVGVGSQEDVGVKGDSNDNFPRSVQTEVAGTGLSNGGPPKIVVVRAPIILATRSNRSNIFEETEIFANSFEVLNKSDH